MSDQPAILSGLTDIMFDYGGELIDFLNSLDLPERTWRKIGRENAERLLRGTAPAGDPPLFKLARTDSLPDR